MRRRITTSDSFEVRRELRRQRRKRSDRALVLMLVAGAAFLFAAVELGRALFHMQGVSAFVTSLDRKSPTEVKTELQRYASRLGDWNPLVRKGSVAAMKAATGWNLGDDPAEWRQWWREHENAWEYRPARKQAATTADWRSNLPPATTSATP